MKQLKAYTFEELLCEIPELEKYKGIDFTIDEKLRIPFKRFCRENYLEYKNEIYIQKIDKTYHFLFEKL